MSTSWADLLRVPAQMVEIGLTVIDAGARTMRQGLDAMAAPQKPRLAPNTPPVHGPQDLDTALADFANQMIRIGWVSSPGGHTSPQAGRRCAEFGAPRLQLH